MTRAFVLILCLCDFFASSKLVLVKTKDMGKEKSTESKKENEDYYYSRPWLRDLCLCNRIKMLTVSFNQTLLPIKHNNTYF